MHLLSLLPVAATLAGVAAERSSTQDQVPLGPSTLFQIPILGFGTWNLKDNATDAVSHAIHTGYRHVDCAAAYKNEVMMPSPS